MVLLAKFAHKDPAWNLLINLDYSLLGKWRDRGDSGPGLSIKRVKRVNLSCLLYPTGDIHAEEYEGLNKLGTFVYLSTNKNIIKKENHGFLVCE